MIRILGIDPGSRLTGFGLIEVAGNRSICISTGCIRTEGENLAGRLKHIHEGISQILDEFQPAEVAIENIFMYRNADSALKLGQARGAALSAVAIRNLPVHEYTPTQIKKAIVGRGNAGKEQVQHMVKAMLALNKYPQADAADALAAALCHSHLRNQPIEISPRRNRRWRSL
ncbi:MAG: crossover junction endodeoxyribonuclease RuvC [Gammaproteobacteria bacterium]|nr:crossover junction endodeoxyribonuclease RuvC [Gammaproteobacteria bacterium]MDH5650904.1 crossover junction endodeoxyribonuclease RuvC [Gammaproteobacteria bacterium]